jgi:hypothetical protein
VIVRGMMLSIAESLNGKRGGMSTFRSHKERASCTSQKTHTKLFHQAFYILQLPL